MTLSKLALITTCAVATAAALLTGCGQDTPQTTTPAADSSSAALEVEATKMLQAVADHDYAAAYQFRSTRCKIAVPEPDYIASMQKQFDQRDFKANPPKIIVSASGTSGS